MPAPSASEVGWLVVAEDAGGDGGFGGAGWGLVVEEDGVSLAVWGGPVDAVGSVVDLIFALVFGAVVASAEAAQVGDQGGTAEGPVEDVVVVAVLGGAAAAGCAAGAVAGVDEVGL